MSLMERVSAFDHWLTAPLTLPERCRVARGVAIVVAHSGDAAVWAGLVVAAWFFGDAAWKGRALITAAGLVVTELIVVGIKFVLRRPRPPGTSGMIYRRVDPYSFPSGHAARAAMLIVLAATLGPAAMLAAVASWGPVMVLCRVAMRIHYVLDVVVGLGLGTGLGFGVIALARTVASSLG